MQKILFSYFKLTQCLESYTSNLSFFIKIINIPIQYQILYCNLTVINVDEDL